LLSRAAAAAVLVPTLVAVLGVFFQELLPLKQAQHIQLQLALPELVTEQELPLKVGTLLFLAHA
jgi:hypothetical protein